MLVGQWITTSYETKSIVHMKLNWDSRCSKNFTNECRDQVPQCVCEKIYAWMLGFIKGVESIIECDYGSVIVRLLNLFRANCA